MRRDGGEATYSLKDGPDAAMSTGGYSHVPGSTGGADLYRDLPELSKGAD